MTKNKNILICGERDDIRTMRRKIETTYDGYNVEILRSDDTKTPIRNLRRRVKEADLLVVDIEHTTGNTYLAIAFAIDFDIEIAGYYVVRHEAGSRLINICDWFDNVDHMIDNFAEFMD